MEVLAVDRLEHGEVFFFTGMLVSNQQLVQYVLGIDKVLSVQVFEKPIIGFSDNVKIIEKFILQITNVIRLDACQMVVNEIDVFIVLGVG